MNILHLTIKRRWFDLIASGDKPEEYRLIKPYWTKRLVEDDFNFVQFDEIHFHNGPHFWATLPLIRTKHSGTRRVPILLRYGCMLDVPNDGTVMKGSYYGIILGEILEVRK